MIKEQQKQDDSVVAPPQQQTNSPFFKGQTTLAQNTGAQPLQVGPSGAVPSAGGPSGAVPVTAGPSGAVPVTAGPSAGGPVNVAATPSVDMDNERRIYIDGLKEYIKTAGENMAVSKVDAAMLDKMLKSWMEMYGKAEDIIGKIGSEKAAGGAAGTGGAGGAGGAAGAGSAGGATVTGDPALLESVQKSFASSIRSLFIQASKTTQKPLIRLFLENSSKLPTWAWPDSGLFTGGNEKEKRAFAADFASALNDVSLLNQYGVMDRPKLEEILGRLNTLVDGAQVMIAGQLNNDNNLRTDLRVAYSNAVKSLLMGAAPALNSSLFKLYMEYRYGPKPQLIHEWADERFSNINPPVPLGAGGVDPLTGDVTFILNGFKVIIKPDGVLSGTDPHYTTPGFSYAGGTVTAVDPVTMPTIIIKSNFQADAHKNGPSGYGRGTTDNDKKHGDTSLSDHEASHARDYISFINANPAPRFGGKVGQTVNQFHTATTDYQRALSTYFGSMGRTSELLTDCVGKPTIEEFYAAKGQVSPVRCH
jgi:hypothetical protein